MKFEFLSKFSKDIDRISLKSTKRAIIKNNYGNGEC